MSLMDELNAEVSASMSQFDSVFKLPDGEKARIRFLCNGNQGIKFPVHGRWIAEDQASGYTVPCATRYMLEGLPRFCPFCQIPDDENTATKNFYAWLIWNYNAGKVQAFAWKANKTTPLAWLSEYYTDHETQQGLLGRDFNVKREGTGFKMVHHMSPMDPSQFNPGVRVNIPTTQKQIEQMILRLFAEKHFPALLRPGELIVPTSKVDTTRSLDKFVADTSTTGNNGSLLDDDLDDADSLLPTSV